MIQGPETPAEFAAAMDDQLRTVKRIGDTLGLKPAVAEAAGSAPSSGETCGAKIEQ